MPQAYDIAFLGGGPAGYQGAIRAAQLGARVAVVEESFLGGVCLNWGCIPTKTVRASAEVGRAMRRAREYGFQAVEANPDIQAIIARKERVVSGLRASIGRLFQAHRIALVEGRGRLIAPMKIEVEREGQVSLIEGNSARRADFRRFTRLTSESARLGGTRTKRAGAERLYPGRAGVSTSAGAAEDAAAASGLATAVLMQGRLKKRASRSKQRGRALARRPRCCGWRATRR